MKEMQSVERGPFFGVRDAGFHLGPCDLCGYAGEDSMYISRLRCEKCGQVICWQCADCGVYGSISDFQSFVYRHSRKKKDYFLLAENCPNCQEMRWWAKYGKPLDLEKIPNPSVLAPVAAASPKKSYWFEDRPENELHELLVRTLRGMLDGSVGLIAGSRLVWRVRFEMDSRAVHANDLVPFIALDSLTDHLPVGEERKLWDERALARKDEEIQKIEAEHRGKIEAACRLVLKKLDASEGGVDG